MRKGRVLGISAYYHDSAAALLDADGDIIAAAQEERFSREKHTNAFPSQAIEYVLTEGACAIDELDAVVFYDKPLLKFERLLETAHALAPRGSRWFASTAPYWTRSLLFQRKRIRDELQKIAGRPVATKILFSEHHLSHAASAYYPSPFDEAAILTIDGVGEWTTASIAIGRGNEIEVLKRQEFPHSIGLFYSTMTSFCGFRVNEDEYKLMGLAAYGGTDSKKYEKLMRESMLNIKKDGSVGLNMDFFDFQGTTMFRPDSWKRLLSLEPRQSDGAVRQEYMDIAKATQNILEEVVVRLARTARELTGIPNLVMAGGVALNCVANGKLLRENIFDRVWIQPAAGDAGGALGAALAGHCISLGRERFRASKGGDSMHDALLGPKFDDDNIASIPHTATIRHENTEQLCRDVAARLADGKIIGWFQGRMEWGPRALGARSILADPRRPEMREHLNTMIKRRENFRPFAAAILAEDASQYFEMDGDSPYMLFTFPATDFGRKMIPAAIHVDGSSRVQTVNETALPIFGELLTAFKELTGCSALLNTSFNSSAEPIVYTPGDAYKSFTEMKLDGLVVGLSIFDKHN